MTSTGFFVTDPAQQARLADPLPGKYDALDRDPRIATRWESGGGGLVSTIGDYARFTRMLLNGGTLDGKRYLSPKTVAYMGANHIGPAAGVVPGPYYLPGPGFGFGLGFAVRTDEGMAPFAGSVGQYFWSGMAGTFFWIDPKEELFALFLSQGPGQREYFRTLVRSLVYAAVE